jgi:hypothetical protein
MEAMMQTIGLGRMVDHLFGNFFSRQRKRRQQLAEFDQLDLAEKERIANDLKISISELRLLAGRDEDSANLLFRRLASLHIDSGKIDRAVLRDLQRCCSNCDGKDLCEHELEDKPQAASWPRYCPNEQTIEALQQAPSVTSPPN